MSELLPCPFCGSAPVTNRRGQNLIGRIYCKSDDCFGPCTTAVCYADSVLQWNARPRAPAQGTPFWLDKIEQRLNESGTGEMGLLDTIHAVAGIVREARSASRSPAATEGLSIAQLQHIVGAHEQTIEQLREEVEKWHRVAMEAGAITCVGGGHIYPLKDEVKQLRAQVESASAIHAAAVVWWANKRPIGWSETAHSNNPTVNCSTPSEKNLAKTVAIALTSTVREADHG